MKYIKMYADQTAYDADKGKKYPNVGYVEGSDTVIYMNEPDWSKEYLTFEALESGTFKFSGNTVDYSLDGGDTWTTLANNTDTPTVNAGEKIMFKTTNRAYNYNGPGRFSSTCRFTAMGNAYSIGYNDNFDSVTTLNVHYSLTNLFSGCTNLVSAEHLVIPATTLCKACYYDMFAGCTSLTKAPKLPATTLAEQCYHSMFARCASLTTAPELPVKTLFISCYDQMFAGCTSLATAPELPATTMTKTCYYEMFNGCTSLTTAPALPATTLGEQCYQNMFRGCTSLTTAPALPATTLTSQCYNGMFSGCTSLTTAPELSAATLVYYCYRYMFTGCSKLSNIKMLATDISATNCLQTWVRNVASSGTFVKHPSMSSLPSGSSGIPTGWTVIDA